MDEVVTIAGIEETRKSSKIYRVLTATSLVVAFPSTVVYYLAPFFVILFDLKNQFLLHKKRFFLIILFLIVHSIFSYGTEYFFLDHKINAIGLLYSLIMYMPVVLLLSSRKDINIVDNHMNKLVRYVAYFMIVQSLVAFTQAILGGIGSGDWVAGTFGLFDFINGVSIAQVMFAFNTFVITFFLFPYWQYKIVKFAVFLSMIAIAASQSAHQTLFFVVSLVVVYAKAARPKFFIGLIVLVGLLYFFVITFFPETINIGIGWYQRLFIFSDIPKVAITFTGLGLLGNAKVFLLGTGLGQFCSRGALFSSGEYISSNLPAALTGKSYYYSKYVEPEMYIHRLSESPSAIATPNYSLLSVVVELGVIVFLVLFVLGIVEWRKNKKLFKNSNAEIAGLAKFINATLLFTLLSCFIENYLEFVQATTLPVLLIIVAKSRIAFLNK